MIEEEKSWWMRAALWIGDWLNEGDVGAGLFLLFLPLCFIWILFIIFIGVIMGMPLSDFTG